jgi:hypothetical protein
MMHAVMHGHFVDLLFTKLFFLRFTSIFDVIARIDGCSCVCRADRAINSAATLIVY